MKSFFSYFLSFSAIAMMIYLASCTKDKAEQPSDTLDTVGCILQGDTITYVADIKKIMETYCTDESFGTCHQSELVDTPGTPGLDYTTYGGIKEQAADGDLIIRIKSTDNPMPSIITKGPQTLSDCDALKIERWVEQGYPEQ